MPLIPKADPTNTTDETVTTAREAHSNCEATEAKLKQRLAETNARVATLTNEEAEAQSAVWIADIEEAGEEKLAGLKKVAAAIGAELDAANLQARQLTHAVRSASERTVSARLALQRVAYRNSVVRMSKLLERMVRATVAIENAIQDSVDNYRALLTHVQAVQDSWPAGQPPMNEFLSAGGIDAAILQTQYKLSAIIDPTVNVPTSQWPGSRALDMALIGQPEKIRSVSDLAEICRVHLLDVLEGRKEAHDGSLTDAGRAAKAAATPVIQTGAELVDGKLKSDTAPQPIRGLSAIKAAEAQAHQKGAELDNGQVKSKSTAKAVIAAP